MKKRITLCVQIPAVLLALILPGSAQEAQWGTIKVRIIWGGKEIPKQVPIAAVKSSPDAKECTMDGKVEIVDEKYVVHPKNKGLRWTFVWLEQEDVKSKTPLPIHPDFKEIKEKEVVMDYSQCVFVPHALAMRQGQTLVAKNNSNITHHFKGISVSGKNTIGGGILIPTGNSSRIKDLIADDSPILIECNIHPWMRAWVRIFDHPYFAVTDADGAFEIKNAPAGAYRLVVRHGEGGWLGGAAGKNGKVINIKAGGTLDSGNIDFPPPQ